MATFPCRACGAPLTIDEPLPRDAECPACGHDVRCCLNCRHYDPRLHNACRETEADPVDDPHRRNFCEYMSPNREPWTAAATGRADAARAKLDQLFGGGPKPAASANARDALERLFRKDPPAEE